ncbi:uncharacterized protein LOC125206293 [Salvia hispanica]|uniref:uncharacterized protein LOC125206293 n=1 Tax=Salvia hispanica TaxID=49212 RepID=UPI002008FCF5|nr:uncharacterized protein LOC125206293 [Salvia hispanica]
MEARDEYFQQREDAAHRKGLSPLTKCMVALRQLAYGTTTDMFNEYLHGVFEGSNNYINVLNSSSLFTEQCNGNGPVIKFTVNGRQYHMGYYLDDDIYPRWPVFLKTISCPTDERRELFASRQEAARKDV